jgi:glycosyl transferase family 87
MAILQGQDSILMLLGFCLAYRYLKSGAGFLAGVLLGLTMFKPQIAIPLAAFLFVRYASFAISGGLAVGVAGSALLSICVSGWSVVLSFGRVLKLTTAATLAPNSGPVLGVAPTAMPNLKGLISGITLNRLPATATLLITVVLSVGIAIAVMRSLRATKPSPEVAFSVALTAALLLSYYLHLQDLALLLLPLGFLAGPRNRNFAVASWLLYIAPPLVVMLGHGLIFLLSLPVLFLLLAATARAGSGPSLRARATASA